MFLECAKRILWILLAVALGSSVSWCQYPTATVTIQSGQLSGAAVGTLTLSVGSISEKVSYGPYSTPSSIASAFAAEFSADPISEVNSKLCTQGVCAKASGPTITFQLINSGTFGPISFTGVPTSGSNPYSATPPVVSAISLTSTSNPSSVGAPATFNVSVTTGATGTVSFYDGPDDIGAAPLANGTATFTTATLFPGTHSITAVYSGDSVYSGSTSSPFGYTVTGISSSVSSVMSIYMFAVGTNGSGSTPTSLLKGAGVQYDSSGNGYVVTDSNGNFNLAGLYASQCPQPLSSVYLYAVAGSSGVSSSNPVALLSALPKGCANMPYAPSMAINELTTVAAVYALADYIAVAPDRISTTSDNASGMSNAFATANKFVEAFYGSVTAQDTGLAVTTINSLANLVAICSRTNATNSCSALFHAVTPASEPLPTNTLDSILWLFGYSTNNISGQFALSQNSSAFAPGLPSQPASWSLDTPDPCDPNPPQPPPCTDQCNPACTAIYNPDLCGSTGPCDGPPPPCTGTLICTDTGWQCLGVSHTYSNCDESTKPMCPSGEYPPCIPQTVPVGSPVPYGSWGACVPGCDPDEYPNSCSAQAVCYNNAWLCQGCDTDNDCPGGLVCVTDSAGKSACGCSSPCDDPQCNGHLTSQCSCNSNSDCPGGQCSNGQCQPACQTDDDCPGSEACVSGVCQSTCSTEDDCSGGLTCTGGACGCSNPCDDQSCQGYTYCGCNDDPNQCGGCDNPCNSSQCTDYDLCTCNPSDPSCTDDGGGDNGGGGSGSGDPCDDGNYSTYDPGQCNNQ